jgi:hypothetical protein
MSSTTNHQISLADAVALTTRFQASIPAGLPVCETFDAGAVSTLLAASGTASLRIYFGQQADGTVVAVLVAADADGNDILPVSAENFPAGDAVTADDAVILEDGYRCPQYCPSASPLVAS